MIRSRLRFLGVACILLACTAVTPAAARPQVTGQDTTPLGSTRNSVVAIPAAELPDELVYLTTGMSEELLASIQTVAPNIRIMVSEQVEPTIYDNSTYPGSQIDIWMPTISNYQVELAHTLKQEVTRREAIAGRSGRRAES